MRVPLSTMCPILHSSPDTAAEALHLSKCPLPIASLTSVSSLSTADASSSAPEAWHVWQQTLHIPHILSQQSG